MVTSSSKINKLFSEIDVNYKKILIQNHFPYVFTKSFYFLEDGEDLYRQKDFFNLPDQSFNDDDSFHTLIIKKSVGYYVYLVALGYEGGRTYGEFYSKLNYDENFDITGNYSNSTGSGEWEHKLLSLKFNQNTNLFETETEELYEFMDENDSKIQNQILNEISKYVYWGYDEETGLTVEALLEQYKEHKWSYLNWQLDLTNSTHIPDTAVFTLVVT